MKLACLIAAAALAAAPLAAAPALAQSPAAISAALASPGRPAADKEQDARRHAAEIIAFAGAKPGDKVADIYAGGGYFTRAFASVVGPTGKVYAAFSRTSPAAEALAATPGYSNIAVIAKPWAEFAAPEPLDIVFNSQFYHDLYNPQYGGAGGAPAHNKAVLAALKPGGVLLIIDHSGPAGTGLRDVATTHRIDEEAAKRDIVAAGFVYEGAVQILRNAADDRTNNVFDPAIRGKTDQFVLKFRKPR